MAKLNRGISSFVKSMGQTIFPISIVDTVVPELAEALAVREPEIVKILFIKGMAVKITQSLDIPTITKLPKSR